MQAAMALSLPTLLKYSLCRHFSGGLDMASEKVQQHAGHRLGNRCTGGSAIGGHAVLLLEPQVAQSDAITARSYPSWSQEASPRRLYTRSASMLASLCHPADAALLSCCIKGGYQTAIAEKG